MTTTRHHSRSGTGSVRHVWILFCIGIFASTLFLPGQSLAAECSEVGGNYSAGSCSSSGRCGSTTFCMCNTTGGPIETLCCKDSATSVDNCFIKNSSTNTWSLLTDPDSQAAPDATYVTPNLSGALSTEKKSSPVFFTPNFTLPLSEFVAGEKVLVDGSTLGDYISALYVFFVSAAGILAVTMMIYGGIKYTVSFGNPSKLQDARDTITSAMIGLAIALGSYVILLTVSPRLVTFQGLQELGTGVGPPSEWEESLESSPKYGVSYKSVSGNVSTYDAMLLEAAGNDKYFASWLKAIMLVESSGNPQAESKDKNGDTLACGLMQLLPSTAGVNCTELKNNPRLNIQKGTEYFQSLINKTCPQTARYKSGKTAQCIPTCPTCLPKKTQCENGKIHYAIAAYNGGLGANCGSVDCPGSTWWECEANPGYQETRNYVAKVEDTFNKIQNDPAFAWSL